MRVQRTPPAGLLPTVTAQMSAGGAALTLSPCCPFCRIADSYVAVKEKTSNCKNVLQQRYEGLKADSIGGTVLPGQPFALHCNGALSSGVSLLRPLHQQPCNPAPLLSSHPGDNGGTWEHKHHLEP